MASTHTSTTTFATAFEQEATRLFEEFKIPGVALGLLTPDGDLFVNLGVTSLDNPLPITSETLFQIGSITKTLTSLTCSVLVALGQLELDAPVRTYLPAFKLQDESVAAQVTMLDLLTHQGGFHGDLFEDTGDGDDALAKVLDKLAEVPQVAPLRGPWGYSNSGFYVAGRVIEVITGKTYEAAVTELVLTPLGMQHTLFFPNQIMTYRFVAGHNTVNDEMQIQRPWMMERSGAPSGSSCASTVSDMATFARYIMSGTITQPPATSVPASGSETDPEHQNSGGTAPEPTEPSTLAGLERTHLWRPVRPTGMGVGAFPGMQGQMGQSWFLDQHPGVLIMNHGGATPGQQAYLWVSPDRGVGFIALTNVSNGSAFAVKLSDWVKRELLGLVKPEFEEVQLDAGQLEAFVGTYTMVGGTDKIIVAVQEGQLVVTDTAAKARQDPPRPLRFIAPGHAIVVGGPSDGRSVEFLTQDGQVAFLRAFLRLFPREQIDAPNSNGSVD